MVCVCVSLSLSLLLYLSLSQPHAVPGSSESAQPPYWWLSSQPRTSASPRRPVTTNSQVRSAAPTLACIPSTQLLRPPKQSGGPTVSKGKTQRDLIKVETISPAFIFSSLLHMKGSFDCHLMCQCWRVLAGVNPRLWIFLIISGNACVVTGVDNQKKISRVQHLNIRFSREEYKRKALTSNYVGFLLVFFFSLTGCVHSWYSLNIEVRSCPLGPQDSVPASDVLWTWAAGCKRRSSGVKFAPL